ncbi:MAG: type IV pilus modification protein PilV, partial [Sedimenticolaceae bacterium]
MVRVHKYFLPSQSKGRGFSLLEVLISIVVLSVGLLGIAGLQLMSLKMNDSAYCRSQAVVLAEDMLERMRSNRILAISGDYDYAGANNKKSDGVNTAPIEDVEQWLKLLKELPGGNGKIERSNNDIVIVTVEWNDSRG